MKIAIVDYDGTLFKEETIPFLMRFAGKGKVPKKDYYLTLLKVYFVLLRYKSGLDKNFGKERFHHEVATAFLSIFKNMNKSEIQNFFKEAVIEAEKLFNPKVISKLKQLKSEGYLLILLSGGFLPYVNLVGKKLEFDKVFATELEFIEKGFNLKKKLNFITGNNKKKLILENFKDENVDWEASYAYADSYFDSEVLELTGNPHAVNPDPKLRKYATDRGWPIID